MAEVESAEDLLINALQDLRAAEVVLADRLPRVTKKACDDKLVAIFSGYAEQANNAAAPLAEAIERLGGDVEGAANIWMTAVLKDAKRDTKTVARGDMLDVALVGALRKGAQAARVSYETAIALAKAVVDEEAGNIVTGLRDAHNRVDDDLAALLAPLTGTRKQGTR